MRKLVVLIGVIVGAALWAVPAFAANKAVVDPAGLGYIEICKTAGTGIASGTLFGFSVPAATTAGQRSLTVAAGGCSSPIQVAGTAGTDGTFTTTVTETPASWFAISGISVTTNYNGATTSVPTNTTSYTVMGGNAIANETRVTITNTLVTGFVEVCKSPAPNSGLTSGQFSFRVQAGFNSLSSTYMSDQTINVGLNQCSAPLAVPAGNVLVTETGTGVFITDVTSTTDGGVTNTHPAVTNDGVTVGVAASTTAGTETRVTFFDALSSLKICKIGGTNPLGTFTGTSSFTVTGVSGVTAPVTVAAAAAPGNCIQVSGAVAPGSTVTIAEAPTVGTWVSGVDLNGTAIGTSASLAVGTVSFTAVDGANVVTFTNELAPTVPLKLCKAAGAAGSTVSFTINGAPASIVIPSDGSTACTQPMSFAYGSAVTITESVPAGSAVAGVTIDGNATFAAGSPNTAGGTATVMVGTYAASPQNIAVITFTNGPAPVTPPVTPVTPVTPAPTPVAATSGSSTSGATSPSSTTGAGGVAGTGSTSSLTKTPSVVKSPIAVKLVTARFVSFAHGALKGRWLGVQLKGNTPTTKIKILLVGRTGNVIGTLTRTVKTGHFVRVMKVGASVRSVKVSPLKL